MDSQNGMAQEKVEQGEEENSVIDSNFDSVPEQCSASADQSDLSCPKTVLTSEIEIEGEQAAQEDSSVQDNNVFTATSALSDENLQNPETPELDVAPTSIQDVASPSNASPVSDNSEGSGIEIALDPVSADDMADECERSNFSSKVSSGDKCDESKVQDSDMNCDGSLVSKLEQAGPSDDREDISDEEFDLLDHSLEPSSEDKTQYPLPIVVDPLKDASLEPTKLGVTGDEKTPPACADDNEFQPLASVVKKGDVPSPNSSEGGEIIDLKLEDAVLKSSSSFDDEENKVSKVSQEDLEAVSDDELPSAPVQVSTESSTPQLNSNLIEGGEQVSSSDEGSVPEATAFTSRQDSNLSQSGAVLASVPRDNSMFKENVIQDPNLQSLDAEPISDEDDIGGHASTMSPTLVEGGEAGEIKSPEIGSPISDQGDLMLGEVEPISAEEDSDTDGELPSGDEHSNSENKMMTKGDDKFEYIESDEEMGLEETKKTEETLRKMFIGANFSGSKTEMDASAKESDKGEYMETISDEEDVVGDNNALKKEATSSNMPNQISSNLVSSRSKEEFGKRINQSNFNEHQVELDYEETEGDDIDQKPPEIEKDTAGSEPKLKVGGEDGEVYEDGGSDKDEGELTDDDCEEGEIKEPGAKKPFIKPVCRFFQRGNCTWGISCRFIHPGVNDKGNYQMIEIPGFKPVGVHARLGGPGGPWPEGPPEEEPELPPPPIPDVPHAETAWERGLRIAKEQRKKASERKEQEPDFEEKRLNLSVDEERELNKENERMPQQIIPKDPYYDQQAYEFDEYYKIPQDSWHAGHYDNFEVRYQREPSFPAPQYRVNEKPPMIPPARYNRHVSPPIDKFGRQRDERRDPVRPEPRPPTDYPSPAKPADEWTDPWRRSKSPKQRKIRAHSRGKRSKRSLSDSSNSSRSSRSSSGSSRSSRSGSASSGSSSRSRSPGPGHGRMGRMDRPPDRYGEQQPRSMVSVRGPNYNNYDNYRGSRGGRGGYDNRNNYNHRPDGHGYGGRGNHYNSYGGGGGGRGGFNNRDPRDQRSQRGGWDGRPVRHRSPTPDRPLPYVRPRRKSVSSRSSSSRSRSRSGSKYSDSSRSRSSSASSRSSSSSSSSAASADSEHLYRDLGSPSRNPRSLVSAPGKPKPKQRPDGRREHGGGGQASQRHNHHHHHHSQQQPPLSIDRIPHPREPYPRDAHPRDPKSSQIPLPPSGSGRSDSSKYASRNAPQAPIKAKDPLKVVGQKSNIKLTLLPKQQQQSTLGDRPNPLASPPHKRRLSERESSPPAKRVSMPVPQTSSLRMAADKAAKIQMRSGDKGKSPPPSNASGSSSNQVRSKSGISPQKQPSSKSRPPDVSAAKPASKNPSAGPPPAAPASKAKKSMSSRREELLKQLKAVEDAIARKKCKLP